MSDTGVGIAPEDQEAVFEEFRQVGRADKNVEHMVKSQVGQGSTSRSRYRCTAANELILLSRGLSQNLKLVRDTLQIRGYQTIEAGTGEEGVRLAREQHPALVLMDIQLPGISSVEAFHQLRADPATHAIPVVAVTASVMAQERQKVIATGFDGFQGKPISVRELLETVRKILDKSAH